MHVNHASDALLKIQSGVLKNVFILSMHGAKANIRSTTKMAKNRHACNKDILQSYWTSDGLPLYCSQPLYILFRAA